jgi:hypothetical protein
MRLKGGEMITRALLSTIGALLCLLPIELAAEDQQALSPGAVQQSPLPTFSSVVRFEGAENRNCPTGAGMFTLLGSRALLTIPQIPQVPKDRAVSADIDGDFFGNTIVTRTSALPDRTGTLFEFMGRTCTVEITIKYR